MQSAEVITLQKHFMLRFGTRDVHGSIFCDPTRSDPPITSRILTRPEQFIMTPKVEFSKYSIDILYVVKFIFKNVKSDKHDICEKYA